MHPADERAALNAILRTEFESFLLRSLSTLNPGMPYLPNWHIRAIAYQLERIRRGEINRLIINMPPRHLKSLTVSVAFPAFLLGLEPWHRIFVISYASELALKHARDSRSIMEAGWYRRAFPEMQIKRSTDEEITTTKKGFRKATSPGGTLTGLGGDILILDDPQKPVDAQSKTRRDSLNQWFTNTLMSRLDNKVKGAIIVVSQRVHMDDLSGHLMGGSDAWEVLSLPAIAECDEQVPIGPTETYFRAAGEALHPEHESLATLKVMQKELGSYDFGAQYQQSPIPEGGAMIKRHWLRFEDAPPERKTGSKIVQSWDVAAKDGVQNDYSVCTTWLVQEGEYHLIDVVRGRYDYPKLKATALALAERHDPTAILIEDASAGISLAQELRALGSYRVKAIPIDHDKVTRLYVQTAKFEAGKVFFPKHAAFMPDLLDELMAFPHGKHDDQVDSISQVLGWTLCGYAEALMAAMAD
ncbi:MAG: phage terminase large subunit [Methyloligella sp. ZOD6]